MTLHDRSSGSGKTVPRHALVAGLKWDHLLSPGLPGLALQVKHVSGFWPIQRLPIPPCPFDTSCQGSAHWAPVPDWSFSLLHSHLFLHWRFERWAHWLAVEISRLSGEVVQCSNSAGVSLVNSVFVSDTTPRRRIPTPPLSRQAGSQQPG